MSKDEVYDKLGLGRPKASSAFEAAFELIGGVRRLAEWADENPTNFFQLYSKLIPHSVQVDERKEVTVRIEWASPDRLSYRNAGVQAERSLSSLPQPEAAVGEFVHAPAGGEDGSADE